MKNTILTFSLLTILIGICTNANSQTVKYSSPEDKNHTPQEMTSGAAGSEINNTKATCGFSGAYFSKADIEHLLDLNKCVGLRIYNGKADSKQQYSDIIVVAIDGDGKEIGHFLANKYLHTKSLDEVSGGSTATKVSHSFAKTCVTNVSGRFSAFFSKDAIQSRLSVKGASGLRIVPAENGSSYTTMISAVKLDKGKFTDLGDKYVKSRLPCPTECGDIDNYLVAPK